MRTAVRIGIVSGIAWSLTTPFVFAGASLALVDGRVIEAASVEREGDFYLIKVAEGSMIAVPYELVLAIRLTEDSDDDVAKAPPPPSGLRDSGPETLAGAAVDPPRIDEQLEVLGSPARFREDPVKPQLAPSYWELDPRQNDFHPASWAQSPVRWDWQPTSAFDGRKDVLADRRTRWRPILIDPAWMPVDGFKSRGW